jgi:uncharacterized protein YndB with AHSA1/START domain
MSDGKAVRVGSIWRADTRGISRERWRNAIRPRLTHDKLEPGSGTEQGISEGLARVLSNLKIIAGNSLSDIGRMAMTGMTSESTIYVTYIAAAPDKVWAALTQSEFTTQYFFGRSIESDWERGSTWLLRMPDRRVDVRGEVRESDPPRRLVVSWIVEWNEALRKLPESIITYEIEPVGNGVVRLTMTEAHPTPIPAYLLEGGRRGWPMVLSGLKSLVETGKPLDIPVPPQPSKD